VACCHQQIEAQSGKKRLKFDPLATGSDRKITLYHRLSFFEELRILVRRIGLLTQSTLHNDWKMRLGVYRSASTSVDLWLPQPGALRTF
jgi:hypothetical protein